MNLMQVTVIGTNEYDYVKPDTGERKVGASITYLSPGLNGWETIDIRLTPEQLASQFSEKTGVYDIEIGFRQMIKGGLIPVFHSAILISKVDLDFPSKLKRQQSQQTATKV